MFAAELARAGCGRRPNPGYGVRLTHGARETDDSCGDFGGRAWNAVLAAEPDQVAEATAAHRGPRDDAGADCRAVASGRARGADLDSHQCRAGCRSEKTAAAGGAQT